MHTMRLLVSTTIVDANTRKRNVVILLAASTCAFTMFICFGVLPACDHDGLITCSRDALQKLQKAKEARKVVPNTTVTASACDSEWGVFSPQNPLSGWPQVINPSAVGSNTSTVPPSEGLKDIIIHPPSNTLFCTIPKNGCSQWRTVLAKVVYNDTSKNGPHYHLKSESQLLYGGESRVRQMLADRTATKVVMVRDPLARFVSGYLDKCFRGNCTAILCNALRRHDDATSTNNMKEGERLTFRKALEWALDTRTDLSTANGHWRMQSEMCGLKDNIGFFSIIGLTTKSTLSRDATCIMDRAGLSQYNVVHHTTNDSALEATSDEPFWRPHSDMIKGWGAETRYQATGGDETEMLRRLYTPELARRAIRRFQQDYDMFHIPEPDWIDQATGEWTDSTDHHSCRGRRGE